VMDEDKKAKKPFNVWGCLPLILIFFALLWGIQYLLAYFSSFDAFAYFALAVTIIIFAVVDFAYLYEFLKAISAGMKSLPGVMWSFIILSILVGLILGPLLINADIFLPFSIFFPLEVPQSGVAHIVFFAILGGISVFMLWGAIFKVKSTLRR